MGVPIQLAQARLLANKHWPYFAAAIWRITFIESREPLPGPMGIDDRWRVYYHPDWLEKLTLVQLAFCLAHEIGHCLRLHSKRMGDRNPRGWNIAGDLEINDDLVVSSIVVSSKEFEPLFPQRMGVPAGKTAEWYYEHFSKEAKKAGLKAHCGQAADGQGPKGDEGKGDPEEGVSPGEAELIRHEVARAVKSRGDVPAGLKQWAGETLDPQVAWDQLLRRYISRAGQITAGSTDYTYRRASRRRWDPILLPRMVGRRANLAIVQDTSGSMHGLHAQALAEVRGIARAGNMDAKVYFVDAAVAGTGKAGDRALGERLAGGGGTDMRVGIKAALEGTPAPDVLVVITDGETPWPTVPPPVPTVIALVADDAGVTAPPAWAQVVRVQSPRQ